MWHSLVVKNLFIRKRDENSEKYATSASVLTSSTIKVLAKEL